MALFEKKSESQLQPKPAHVFVQNNSPEDKASEYRPLEGGMTYKKLWLATWYLKNKFLFQKIGLGILIGWCVFSVGYSGYRWAEYFILGYWEDLDLLEVQVAEVPNYQAIQPRYSAQDIQFDHFQVFDGIGNKYDFVTETTNQNKNWIAEVFYKYVFAGGETEEMKIVLLPGSHVPLVFLGHESENYPVQARLEIIGIDWQKINPHEVSGVENFLSERLMFGVSPFQFTRASSSDLPVNRLEFTLTNDSAYSYWQVLFYVVLINGGQTEGVIQLDVDEFKSGEELEVDLRLVNTSLQVNDIQVIPVVNIFDKEVYMEPEG